jgi:hypothetical protein
MNVDETTWLGGSVSLTLLLLPTLPLWQSSSVICKVTLIAFMLYGMRLSFSCLMYFMLSNSDCILLKICFPASVFDVILYFY